MTHAHPGATLVELIVTLAVLATVASVTTLAARRLELPVAADPAEVITDSARVAVSEARAITFSLAVHGYATMVTVHPDGRAIADTAMHIDPLTGRRVDAR